MLRIRKTKAVLSTGYTIRRSFVRITISQAGMSGGATVGFKIDSGADYTLLPVDLAWGMGIPPDSVRRNGKKIAVTSATGHSITAYLFPVSCHMRDDFGGWAEWETDFAFCDLPRGENLAGHVGFLNSFEWIGDDEYFNLEPKSSVRLFQCNQSVSAP